jgi:hypothetical protein
MNIHELRQTDQPISDASHKLTAEGQGPRVIAQDSVDLHLTESWGIYRNARLPHGLSSPGLQPHEFWILVFGFWISWVA